MPKYRKKPIVIEAHLLNLELLSPFPEWLIKNLKRDEFPITIYTKDTDPRKYIVIETLEGFMNAYSGDYIIKGIEGEIYPCKPDIFEATYEKVED